ncbi:gamma-glutamyl-hercynylcysteine sulfoxide hydrolase [Sphaerisporangium melleum]|uniref:Gamma-glutamyl-hercynylcysteine sulfoxide hydrolase n=1 Tax=Sphaerisporangium melleum TaxID=321316 RepID=A0A917R528_9ACTN|nr:ergothioneine biosynthesis protein EgtC [Sphaerisporangium melleum]GGK89617.1 gamma-glutamyl-hercynylcysteine sulfoxide hydrolase [Sphaerisporangium melleum]GII72523.1 gamma-glutamyl-hercynylcysteine sulfoxide hydrolase [Sphaerisporangium melleum]
MCRHAAWLGAPRPVSALLRDPGHGLLRQSYAPRLQRCGQVNADGFGIAWYDRAGEGPVRYRRAMPIWADANLAGLAAVARSGCLMAAVRSASPGMPVEESATAPFTEGRWLLSHNGRVARGAVRPLTRDREPESACDSAWLAAAVFARLASGGPLAESVGEVVALAGSADPDARLNLLVTDGQAVAATAWHETLFVHLGEGVLLASEPLDDRPGWQPVPDRHLVLATPDGLRADPL